MDKIGAITGGIGDCVYAIPVMRKLGITGVYVKENFYLDGSSMYTVLKPLLESQGIQCFPTTGGLPFSVFEQGLKFDYDLDAWRCRPGRDRIHIIKNMCLHYRVSVYDWNKPFLHGLLHHRVSVHDSNKPFLHGLPSPTATDYTLIFLSQRWRENSTVNWTRIHDLLKAAGRVFFIGLETDWLNFCYLHGEIDWISTPDLLVMADVIKGCTALYTNQSVALAIAQGLDKAHYLEVKPGKSNTLFYTPNEYILKP